MYPIVLMILCLATPLMADPVPYDIDPAHTDVGFTYQFGGNPIEGQFPDYSASLVLDLETPANSTVQVTLKTQTSKAGFVFATNAIKSAKILDANAFPTIKFQSTAITRTGSDVVAKGNVTVRGITRPLTLTGKLRRLSGRAVDDNSRLNIDLSGSLNRHDFGASGYPNDVGDTIKINVSAWIDRRSAL